MSKENTTEEFTLEKIKITINYQTKEINQNELMSKRLNLSAFLYYSLQLLDAFLFPLLLL